MKWFYDLKTSTKLMIGYAVLAGAVALAGLVASRGLERTNELLGTLHRTHMVGLSKISGAHIWQLHAVRALRGLLLTSVPAEADKASAEMERNFVSLEADLKD